MQNDLNHPSNTSSPADSNGADALLLSPGAAAAAPMQQGHNSRKRKISTPASSNARGLSSRGVASLTPEQLAKKRANDREAQRAIRERTKRQIETLERRIQELTSQQPYQELQAVIRQKDAIQAENDEIRRRLASVMSIIQPVVGAQGLTDLATAAQHNVQSGLGQQLPTDASQSNSTSAVVSGPYLNGQQPNGARPFSTSPSLPTAGAYSAVPFAQEEPASENDRWHSSREALSHQRDNLQRGLELNESGERLSFNFLLDSLGQRAPEASHQSQHQHSSPPAVRRSPYPSLGAAGTPDQQQQPAQVPWLALPKNIPPTCPLDGLLLNFLISRQRDQQHHHQVTDPQLDPSYPRVSTLLLNNPAVGSGGGHLDPLSQLMTDIISKFPNISDLPEQAATLFAMFVNMRWMINPTRENYERLPEWFRPTAAQIYTPHPAWIDHIPWPRMRDRLVANYQDYPFENWFIPFTNDLSVNWPYDPVDCLLSTTASGGGGGGDDKNGIDDPLINPVFERHIRRLENWSVGPDFADAFPDLVDTARIRRRDPPSTTSASLTS